MPNKTSAAIIIEGARRSAHIRLVREHAFTIQPGTAAFDVIWEAMTAYVENVEADGNGIEDDDTKGQEAAHKKLVAARQIVAKCSAFAAALAEVK